MNANGALQWVRSYSGTPKDLEIDALGNIYTVGRFMGTPDFDPGPASFNLTADSTDVFITKLNSSGDFIWAKKIGGKGTDVGNSLEVDNLGNIYIGGYFSDTLDFNTTSGFNSLIAQNYRDLFISKLNSSGNILWVKQIKGTGQELDCNIAIDQSGNVFSTGDFYGTADFDPDEGNFNFNALGTSDIYILKLNTSGNFEWARKIGGNQQNTDIGNDIVTDLAGNIYSTGGFAGTVDFNPSSTTNNLVSAPISQPDLFIVAYDTAGKYINAQKLGGNKTENPGSFTLNKTGELCLYGNFAGTVDFDFTSSTNNLTATDQDFFITKYSFSNFRNANEEETATIDIPSVEKEASFVIFPNPVVNHLQIKATVGINLNSIKVYNLQGVCLLANNFNNIDIDSSPYSLDVSQLTPGFYVIKINNQFNETFIKQ
jgi:hypothetical protein